MSLAKYKSRRDVEGRSLKKGEKDWLVEAMACGMALSVSSSSPTHRGAVLAPLLGGQRHNVQHNSRGSQKEHHKGDGGSETRREGHL